MKSLAKRISPLAHAPYTHVSPIERVVRLGADRPRLKFRPLPEYGKHLNLDPLRWVAVFTQRAVISFDLETTAFLNDSDFLFGIIEFAAVIVEPTGAVSTTSILIDPGCPIAPAASAKSGIYASDLVGAPTFPEVADELRTLFSGEIAAGHYITSFDVPGLNRECERYGLEPIAIDAYDIRALIPRVDIHFERKRLDDIAATLHVIVDAPKHRAEPDAVVAAGILAEIVARIGVERFLAAETSASRFNRWICRVFQQRRRELERAWRRLFSLP